MTAAQGDGVTALARSHEVTAEITADVVAAWHGHTERMTQAVYGRVTDDRLTAALTAASAVFAPRAIGQS